VTAKPPPAPASFSCVPEQRHEPEIHMQLLMGMIEVHLDFLEAAQHHHVLDDARGRLAADTHELEAVPVQVERMHTVAGVAEFAYSGASPGSAVSICARMRQVQAHAASTSIAPTTTGQRKPK